MSHQFSPAIEQLIRDKMTSGKYASEDEVLRDALQSLDAKDEELRAIKEGIDSVERGEEDVSVEVAFPELRAHHQIRESA
jgi:antitoxin ParD1/3/4